MEDIRSEQLAREAEAQANRDIEEAAKREAEAAAKGKVCCQPEVRI